MIREAPSGKAFLFKFQGHKKAQWIPKSQIIEPSEKEILEGGEQELVIPKWLAQEKFLDVVDE